MATKPLEHDMHELMAGTTVTAIVFGRAGNQIRTAITGGRKHATFMYPSARYGRGQSGDGDTELGINMVSEVLATRLDFLPQPCRIEAEVHGRAACAFPDYAYVDMDRRPVLGEAKRRWEDFERPSALIQQAVTRKGAEALGWDYEQVTSASLGSAGFLAAVAEVQAHRFVHVPMRIERAVTRALDEAGELRLGELASVMGESIGRGTAFACALMVRRVIAIDIDAPLTERSIVKRAPRRPFAFPRIRL